RWMVFRHEVVPTDQPVSVFYVDNPVDDSGFNKTVLGPGLVMTSAQIALGDADRQAFMAERTAVYVYIKVGYNDVFVPGKIRVSEGCWAVRKNGEIEEPGG